MIMRHINKQKSCGEVTTTTKIIFSNRWLKTIKLHFVKFFFDLLINIEEVNVYHMEIKYMLVKRVWPNQHL